MSERMIANTSGRLDTVICTLWTSLSRSRAAALIKEGVVHVDGELRMRPSFAVVEGAEIGLVLPEPKPSRALPEALDIHLIYEDDDVVVVDKAAGMVVHPGAGHLSGTLVNALLHHVGDLSGIGGVMRPGIVHRLDKGTSGLMVVAKHDLAHRHLSEQFAEHSAGRTYLAVTLGVPHDLTGTIVSSLARHPHDRMRFASTEQEDQGKLAVTRWQRARVSDDNRMALIQLALETGRTHQIRVHLSEADCPLLGDPTYSRRRNPPMTVRDLVEGKDRPMLHAWRLDFVHPSGGQQMHFETPPPADFQAVLDRLGWTLPL